MQATWRTPSGGRIDRGKLVRFRFDGRELYGFEGDTLASALLANGIHLAARSLKYHRPRGILAAGAEEPNALVTIRRDAARCTPNLRATQVELYEGLEASSQNRWPSLVFDAGAIAGLAAPLLRAGFYYKTFMWPRHAWKRVYEPLIRAAAGLGRAPGLPDPERYAHRYAHCDVLIVGGGPAGLAAAAQAAASGARVMLCDEQSELGGSLLGAEDATIGGQPARAWLDRTLAELSRNERVTLLARTTAFGYFPHNLVGLLERVTDHLAQPHPDLPRERLWQVRAREVVLATGAIERPLVFSCNDRPGIMLAGAALTYLRRYGVLPGSRAVVVTACDEAYRAALDLHAAGIVISMLVDPRRHVEGALFDAAQRAGLPIELGSTIIGTSGRLRVKSARIAALDADGRPSGRARNVGCDLVLMSGGFTPSVHLHSQSRGLTAWDDSLQAFIPSRAAERTRSVGGCRGLYDLAAAVDDGAAAGAAAARDAGFGPGEPRSSAPQPARTPHAPAPRRAPPLARPRGKAFVDWQNDVTVDDLALAAREGFESIEHVKRYTTTGMATDQGKTSNVNALAIVGLELERSIAAVGHTTFRMPYTPVTFGSFAGLARHELLDPIRTTPMHAWAASRGTVFEDVGAWKRARYFPRDGEDMQAAVARECIAVRRDCGIFDASTLGKIEVVGPDAAVFLNRMYVNDWSSLRVGQCRYGLMLREDGFILDDGVIARVAPERFHVTTTTGGAARVLALMEDYLQTEWPSSRVWLTSTTEQWAVIALQGPRSRDVLAELVEEIDLTPAALPHMSVAEGRLGGVPARLFRVSFTGELGFELNVPSDFGLAAWEALVEAGKSRGITPYGTETMHVLRAEKGYIIVGQDTDGTVTPDEAGLGRMIGRRKTDFVGMRSLQRPAMSAPDRKQLVGLLTIDSGRVLEEGAQVIDPSSDAPRRPIGHVTSSYPSATLGRSIALGLVSRGRARMGETLQVLADGQPVPVRIAAPIFYDAEGTRLHA